MPSIAFFRNLNQGQRTSPSSAALRAAFEERGATGFATHRSNGTVVFEADDPQRCADTVVDLLHARSPWRDVAFVRSGDAIVELADRLTTRVPGPLDRAEVAFFSETFVLDRLPLAGVRSTIVAGGPGYAIVVNDLPKTSQATPSIERILGSPVTSRGASTLIGLASRLS